MLSTTLWRFVFAALLACALQAPAMASDRDDGNELPPTPAPLPPAETPPAPNPPLPPGQPGSPQA